MSTSQSIAITFRLRENSFHFRRIVGLERSPQGGQHLFVSPERRKDIVAIAQEYLPPQAGVARRHSRGVGESAGRERQAVCWDRRRQGRGGQMWQMAASGQLAIVLVGWHAHDPRASDFQKLLMASVSAWNARATAAILGHDRLGLRWPSA